MTPLLGIFLALVLLFIASVVVSLYLRILRAQHAKIDRNVQWIGKSPRIGPCEGTYPSDMLRELQMEEEKRKEGVEVPLLSAFSVTTSGEIKEN